MAGERSRNRIERWTGQAEPGRTKRLTGRAEPGRTEGLTGRAEPGRIYLRPPSVQAGLTDPATTGGGESVREDPTRYGRHGAPRRFRVRRRWNHRQAGQGRL